MAPEYRPHHLPGRLSDEYRAWGLTTDETLGMTVERAARRLPGQAALIDITHGGGREYTYAQAMEQTERFAGFLRARGVVSGDLVMVQTPNRAEAVFAAWAAWRIGAVVNPVVDIYRTHELRHIVATARPDVVVTVPEHRGFRAAEAFDSLLAEAGADVRARVVLGDEEVAGWTSWTEACATGGDGSLAHPHPDDPALVLFTSGTTSLPKGAVHSHRTLVAETLQMANGWSMGWMDRMYLPLPIAHITGVLFALTVPVYRAGTAVLSRMESLDRMVAEIVEHRITHTAGAPHAFPKLVKAYEHAGVTEIPLRVMASGGTSVPKVLIEAAESLGIRPCRIYGMTEMPTVTMPTPADTERQRLATDGIIAPGVACEAVDPETREPLPTGTEGELRVVGPERMLGYLDIEQTRAQIDDDGWFYTGDLGVVDGEGAVSITGRIKDIINRGGEKFSAREIEDVLVGHPSVGHVAVVAAPDPRYGEVPAAFVVAADADRAPDERVLADLLAAQGVAKQKTPVHWRFVDQLPVNASGKVKKFELVAQLRDEH